MLVVICTNYIACEKNPQSLIFTAISYQIDTQFQAGTPSIDFSSHECMYTQGGWW